MCRLRNIYLGKNREIEFMLLTFANFIALALLQLLAFIIYLDFDFIVYHNITLGIMNGYLWTTTHCDLYGFD